jgi:hypothetical protein
MSVYTEAFNETYYDDDNCDDNCCENNYYKELLIEGKNIDKVQVPLCTDDITVLYIKNTNITQLTNIPKNLIELNIIENDIKIIDGSIFPDSLKILILNKNNITSIVNLKEGIIKLLANNNNLEKIPNIPTTVQVLDVSDNENLSDLPPSLSNNLLAISIADTLITNLEKLPNSVEELNSDNCILNKITKLPVNLKSWKSWRSKISCIECELPTGLQILNLYNNLLKEIPTLPDSIINVDLSKNNLEKIPNIPQNLMEIDLEDNELLDIKQLKELEKNNIGKKIMFNDEYFSFLETPEPSCFRYDENNPHYILLPKKYVI